ncbi:complement resistance protein TraT [Escherichia coli]|uniref:complement resistance protein TraT n=1 Tax=Escherichia coli TaxID=562 RepID=UPI00208E77BE|nr:complement resistance protein TraT [Escherichia coli]
MRCRGLIALLIWGQSVAAADLGTWGDLWPVKEPDMLTVIMQRLTALEQSGEMGRKMDAFKERVIRNSLRPPAVPGIGRTEKYGSRLFDPSVRLAADITGYNSNSAGATLGVGLAAGLVGMAADAMVEDVNYTMITDVQIAERTKATVTTDNVAALRQGTSGAKIQTSTETGNQHKYQTRVVSNANKVNLKFEEAKPVLEDQLAKSIANIL